MWAVQGVVDLFLRIDAQQAIHCGHDITRRNGSLAGLCSDTVAGAVDEARLYTATNEHDRITSIPMITSAGVIINFRRSSEIAEHGHERTVESAAGGEILDQTAAGCIELGQ